MAQKHEVGGCGLLWIVRELAGLFVMWESIKHCAGASYNPAAHIEEFCYSALPCAPLPVCVQILSSFLKT